MGSFQNVRSAESERLAAETARSVYTVHGRRPVHVGKREPEQRDEIQTWARGNFYLTPEVSLSLSLSLSLYIYIYIYRSMPEVTEQLNFC